MTMLYPNTCYKEVCYKGTALQYSASDHFMIWNQLCFLNRYNDSRIYHCCIKVGINYFDLTKGAV